MKQVLTRPLNGEATVRRKLIATLSYGLATREHKKSLYRTKSGKVILSETSSTGLPKSKTGCLLQFHINIYRAVVRSIDRGAAEQSVVISYINTS